MLYRGLTVPYMINGTLTFSQIYKQIKQKDVDYHLPKNIGFQVFSKNMTLNELFVYSKASNNFLIKG